MTIDGLNVYSNSLTISNTSAVATAGTSTIRFTNDATGNTIRNCTIKGSTTDASGGVIFFSTTSGTTGNDGNTLDNNSITSAADASRPLNVIYSLGTSAKENSGNTISNNYIYDFLSSSTASFGIKLGNYTTAWTISGNSFYETTSFSPTADVAYNVIYINNTSGTGFSLSGNYIGGNSPKGGSSSWYKARTSTNPFTAI